MWHLFFCVWLISLRIMFSSFIYMEHISELFFVFYNPFLFFLRFFSKKFIFNWRIIALQYCVGFCHTTTCISQRYRTSLLFIWWIIFHCINTTFLVSIIYWKMLGLLPSLDYCKQCCTTICLSSRMYWELLGNIIIICLTYWGVHKCFPKKPYPFTFPPAIEKDSNFSTSLPTLIFDKTNGKKWNLIMVLGFIFLVTQDIGHLFMDFFTFLYQFWRNVYSGPLTIFYFLKIFLNLWLYWVLLCTWDLCCSTRTSLWLWCEGSVVMVCRFGCLAACRILVFQSGMEPASPALGGRFLTSRPPGRSLTMFYIGLFVFLLICTRSLYILNINLLSGIWSASIFFPFCSLPFDSLEVSFEAQKFLIFMKFN